MPLFGRPTAGALAGGGGGSGTVTSVALTVPGELAVAGSPITTTGTLAVTRVNQNANLVMAGPASGAAATPGYRALVAGDLPAGTGTVTSVGLALQQLGWLSVTGSPVIAAGSLTLSRTAGQAAASVLATPATAAGVVGLIALGKEHLATAGATAAALGAVQLAGDFGGTAASPLVAAVQGVVLSATPPTTGQVLTATGAAAAGWATPSAGGANTALSNLAAVAINAALATGAGTVFAGSTTAAAATASTTAGVGLTLTADAAVAGTTNAGAAQGGDMTLTAGAAARLTSGNARGGAIFLIPGAGIGTGAAGGIGLWGTTTSFPGFKQRAGQGQLQITDATWANRQTLWLGALAVGGTMDSFTANDVYLTQTGNSGSSVRVSSGNAFGITSGGDASQSPDTMLSRAAASVWSLDGSTRADHLGWFNYGGTSRVAADLTNATATMANMTMTPVQAVLAGRFYFIRMVVKGLNSTATEGLQFDFNGGTATATDFWMIAGILASGGTDVVGTNISTSLAGVINFTTFTGESGIVFEGYIRVNAAGTLIPRFAENSSAVGTATVRKGTLMVLTDSP